MKIVWNKWDCQVLGNLFNSPDTKSTKFGLLAENLSSYRDRRIVDCRFRRVSSNELSYAPVVLCRAVIMNIGSDLFTGRHFLWANNKTPFPSPKKVHDQPSANNCWSFGFLLETRRSVWRDTCWVWMGGRQVYDMLGWLVMISRQTNYIVINSNEN